MKQLEHFLNSLINHEALRQCTVLHKFLTMHERQYELLRHQMKQKQKKRVQAPSQPAQGREPYFFGKLTEKFTSRFVVPMTATPASLISS